jgi:hypothetical protein
MSNFPALEVVIGLSFVYFVLSLICSAVAESISTLRGLRARTLEEGIMNLLSGTEAMTGEGQRLTESIFGHPLIEALRRPKEPKPNGTPNRKPQGPSYIPAHTFVSALLDLGAQAHLAKSHANGDYRAFTKVDLEDAISALESTPVRQALWALYRDVGGNAAAFRHAAEKWYDDAMQRVSGWYRRHVQLALWAIALVLVVVLNVDTVQVATTLWRDPTTRAAVVAQAEKAVQQGGTNVSASTKTLVIPLGWRFSSGKGAQQFPNSAVGILSKIAGLIATIAALALGAPFWFDLLSRFVQVRGTGAKPPPTPPSPQPAQAP